MPRAKTFVALALAGALIGSGVTRAGGVKEAEPVLVSVDRAELIAVATIEQYTAQPAPAPPNLSESADRMVAASAQRPAGVYRVKVLLAIKGTGPAQLEAHLSMIASFYYGGYKFDLPTGSPVLLLLEKDGGGQWVPVDPFMPLIPLSAKTGLATATQKVGGGPAPDAIDFLLASMPDGSLRPIISRILRGLKDPRMTQAMRVYADDPDPVIRSDVLNCLAVNHDLTAIPKIAQVAAEMEKIRRGSGPVGALGNYTSPEAVKYLNPLIVEGTDLTRSNAAQALRPIADETSIPFLMKALEKDDRQQSVSYDAYWTLHRLAPLLGPANTRVYFLKNRDAEVQALKQWWEWEQVKAKKAAATQTAQTQPAAQPLAPNP